MKAIAFDHFGGPEVLEIIELPTPEPGPDQIRVRVTAAGVNPLDGKIRAGQMEAVYPTTFPRVLGLEFAGFVDKLGSNVTDVSEGDSVVGWTDVESGSYAEFVLASAYTKIPDGLDANSAVTLPVATDAAVRALNLLAIQSGETLLIHGASGAVGSMATQIAVSRGVHVIGTGSARNQELIRSLGATPILYGDGLVDRVSEIAPSGVDAALDTAGKGALPELIAIRGSNQRVVTTADIAARSLGVTFSAGPIRRSPSELASFADQLQRGELSTRIAQVFPYSAVADAHRLSDSGHPEGKIILSPVEN